MKEFEKFNRCEAIKKELSVKGALTVSDIRRIRSGCQCIPVSIG